MAPFHYPNGDGMYGFIILQGFVHEGPNLATAGDSSVLEGKVTTDMNELQIFGARNW